MPTCNDCGQTYRSKGTLKRHQQNHRNADQNHVCQVCHVGFKRRDLLLRHARIHADETSSARRRRCHTACDGCRAAHIRCDGGRPCPMCAQQDRSCTYYSTKTGRVSEQQPSPPATVPENSGIGDEIDSMDFTEPTVSQGSELDPLLLTDTFWPFSTSWQWQHEDQYLPDVSLTEYNDNDILLSSNEATLLASDLMPAVSSSLTQPSSSADDAQNTYVGQSFLDSGLATPSSLRAVVDAMVETVLKSHLPPSWASHSNLVSKFLSNGPSFQSPGGESDKTLFDGLVEQYFDHFHPLWAMIPKDANIQANSHPLLYLTITSIGALYSGTNAAVTYGSLLHKKLREVLVHRPFPQQQSETEALDIGRAMLLTQVAALYFEQDGAFSAAQRLAATLSTHAHRMRLFTSRKRDPNTYQSSNQDPAKDVLLAEGRKMLAFGMIRAETFMSVLFNRKPIISYEEVNLPLPYARDLTEIFINGNTALFQSVAHPCGGLYFSDLVRITLEDDEVLPILRPADAEILLFGLQHEIWRFSHDPDIFYRLVKSRRPIPPGKTIQDKGAIDHLDYPSRKMKALVKDYRQTLCALERWKHAMLQSQFSHVQDNHSRSAFLSGLILHDLSYLRLLAPLDSIQQTAYQLHDPSTSDEEVVDEIYAWAMTGEAHEAIKYARSIWCTLRRETLRSANSQAKYNILALIALHHGAVVIWAVAGADACPEEYLSDVADAQLSLHAATDDTLCRRNTRSLMLRFADIYPTITAAWGMQSSFSKMVRRLADYPLPPRSSRT